jgi:hypothetical protein
MFGGLCTEFWWSYWYSWIYEGNLVFQIFKLNLFVFLELFPPKQRFTISPIWLTTQVKNKSKRRSRSVWFLPGLLTNARQHSNPPQRWDKFTQRDFEAEAHRTAVNHPTLPRREPPQRPEIHISIPKWDETNTFFSLGNDVTLIENKKQNEPPPPAMESLEDLFPATDDSNTSEANGEACVLWKKAKNRRSRIKNPRSKHQARHHRHDERKQKAAPRRRQRRGRGGKGRREGVKGEKGGKEAASLSRRQPI